MIDQEMKNKELVKEDYIVVFVEDGATVQKSKSFKYNIYEIMKKYYVDPPSKIQKPSRKYVE